MSRLKKLKKKRYLIIAIVLVLLIAFRLALPSIVKRYVNKVLADIPGYYGQVADIDIALIRGAYVIEGLYLNKVDAGSQVPFLNFEKTDISVQWKALFKGSIVSEIIMTRPELIYVLEDQKKDSAAKPKTEDWTKALTDLVPIEINHLKIIDGKMAFVELSADPNIDLQLNKVNLVATNLRNVRDKEKALPSTLAANAVSTGNGKVRLDGRINLIKKIPDMDLSFSLENAAATALNDYTNHYAGIDFEEGNFSLYSEVVIADSYLKGYIKPMLKDSKLIGKDDGFLKTLWEGFVGFFKFILKNHRTDTLATKIPIEGDLSKVESGTWPTIINIFRNAWIKAFKGVVDDDIEFEDVKKEKKKE